MGVNNNDIIRATAKMSINGEAVQNVFHFRYQGDDDEPDQDVHDAINVELDDAYDIIDHVLCDVLDFDSIETFNITQDAPINESAWDTLTSGQSTADPTAYQNSALVLFPTGTARSQGRKYIAGWAKTAMDNDSTWGSTVVSLLLTFGLALATGTTTTNGTLKPGNWNETLARFAEWAGATVNEIVKTQRRRSPGVGA
jgi:hypothetical protein